jgi:soluble lytic murein transglycosylase-like protein
MAPEWNSSGVLGGPDRRHGERRKRDRITPDRRLRLRRGHMRTAVIAAAMSSAPIARPAIALFPAANMLEPQIDINTEFEFVKPSEAYEAIIQEAAAEYDLDPNLIRAVMQTESAFHPYAVSRAGAEGLMQLMPALADEMGVSDSFDPRENIMGGTRYLKRLLDYHNGNLDLALASYNAGPGNVERYGGIPPFRETRKYVKTIKALYARSKNKLKKSLDAD